MQPHAAHAVSFFSARNGTVTCSCNGMSLHSAYNPEREAERFVFEQECSFHPACVIVTEPAVSYIAPFLRKRFPRALICAIRYTKDFSRFDSVWDKVFYIGQSNVQFEDELFAYLGEEAIAAALFIAWKPCSFAFRAQDIAVWKCIKDVVAKCQTVIRTRAYFAHRWIKNCCIFYTQIKKTVSLACGSMPVIVAASGPSLESSIEYMKRHRSAYFLLALSSATESLLQAGITPDVVMSTDGGYYAKRHLEVLCRSGKDIPLALPAEAACPAELLRSSFILPLSYDSELEREFMRSCGIECMKAKRNGTVSGTAVQFALSITTGAVYCCGLDLAAGIGHQHSRPNALDDDSSIFDFRLRPISSRYARSYLSSESMSIYRDWFSSRSRKFYERVFRLCCGISIKPIGAMRDILWGDVMFQENTKKPLLIKTSSGVALEERKRKIKDAITALSRTDSWYENAFPADFVLWKKSAAKKASLDCFAAMEQKNKELVSKLLAICT